MPQDHPERFVVERFIPDTTEASARTAMRELRSASERLAATGVRVRYLGGTFVLGDEAMSCRFEGTAQAVRAVHDLAGLTLDRLLPATEVEAQ